MIDWKRKILKLSRLAVLNPLAARKYAEQVLILVQYEENTQDLLNAWQTCQGDRDQAQQDYLIALGAENNYSERMDQKWEKMEDPRLGQDGNRLI